MKRDALILEIEAYASAKASGNGLLIKRQGESLQSLLNQLPEELPEREQESAEHATSP